VNTIERFALANWVACLSEKIDPRPLVHRSASEPGDARNKVAVDRGDYAILLGDDLGLEIAWT